MDKKTRLDNVIELVKAARRGEGRAWIYTEAGEIKPDVITGDIIPFLQDLKEFEINASNNFIEAFKAGADNYYSYNYNACIDKDFLIWYKTGCPVIIVNVHLYGDARIMFDTDFVIKLDDNRHPLEAVFDLESARQTKDINGRFSADIDIFTEGYTIYDYESGEDVGFYYEPEAADLLNELNEAGII